jgi:type IV secretion system protein VirB1
MIDVAIYQQCAPDVHPATMAEIVRVESSGRQFVINVVKQGPQEHTTKAEALAAINTALAQGRNVAIGLMQVTTQTAKRLGYTPEQLLDACTNLRAGAEVLKGSYLDAKALHGEGQKALQAALSAYESGNFLTGFADGYVGLYYGGKKVIANHYTVSPYGVSPTVYKRKDVTHDTAGSTATQPVDAGAVADDDQNHAPRLTGPQ